MQLNRVAPTAWIVTAVTGGVLFVIGGIITTVSNTPRLVMAGGALLLVLLGAYSVWLHRRNGALIERNRLLGDAIEMMRVADTSLRTRMAYTLRDPLTSIVGFADRMVASPGIAFDEQREMLLAVRTNAREVEMALADLADVETVFTDDSAIEGIVLLDEEIESIASTLATEAIFESELGPARAWGDSARVRQILRAVLKVATDSGCAYITLRTAEGNDRATATVSGRDDLLPIEALAALTGNAQAEDRASETYRTLRTAYEIAASMNGSIDYAQAFGISHIVIDLPSAPADLRISTPRPRPPETMKLPLTDPMDLPAVSSAETIRFD